MQVVGVATGGLFGEDTTAQLERFVAQTNVTFPVGRDDAGTHRRYPTANSISPFPLDVVVDKLGNIAYFNRAFDPESMKAVIQSLIAQ